MTGTILIAQKCRCCGAKIPPSNLDVVECEYCGTKYSVEKLPEIDNFFDEPPRENPEKKKRLWWIYVLMFFAGFALLYLILKRKKA